MEEQVIKEQVIKEQMGKEQAENGKTLPREKRASLKGNDSCKAIAGVLLVLSATLIVACAIGIWYLWEEGYYTKNIGAMLEQAYRPIANRDYEQLREFYAHDNRMTAYQYAQSRNIWYTVYYSNGVQNAGNYQAGTPYGYVYQWTGAVQGRECQFSIYIREYLTEEDEYFAAYRRVKTAMTYRWVPIKGAVALAIVCFVLFLYLMSAAGHHNGKEGIVRGVFTGIYFDVFSALFACLLLLVLAVWDNLLWWGHHGFFGQVVCILVYAFVNLTLLLLYLMDLAIRFKLELWWQHTLTGKLLGLLWKLLRRAAGTLVYIIKNMPSVILIAILCVAICDLELVGILLTQGETDNLLICWFLEKLILTPYVLYFAISYRALEKGAKNLADGNLQYQINTAALLVNFRKHGESLNQIRDGISKAVEKQLKSEHMKTELITNVSHDLKTPLTSIINYAELLNVPDLSKEQVQEYAEVLLRQSNRLKKLLEDLLEVSKATTGNLELHPEKCAVGVMLTQAVGEFESRFRERGLDLIQKNPEEEVYIMADGRRLWRIFDNLLNNICKYAQEGSRVYLHLEKEQDCAVVTFRNMSAYPLDISSEELMERFVRGDKSRHMEGNGLGLSIAQNLTQLQNGEMEIVIDGDLFKVILRFPVVS